MSKLSPGARSNPVYHTRSSNPAIVFDKASFDFSVPTGSDPKKHVDDYRLNTILQENGLVRKRIPEVRPYLHFISIKYRYTIYIIHNNTSNLALTCNLGTKLTDESNF